MTPELHRILYNLGIPDVLHAYRKAREHLDDKLPLRKIPQLVICGHGSVDDPDGTIIFDETVRMLDLPDFTGLRPDICVVRLPPSGMISFMRYHECQSVLWFHVRNLN
jgi:hypothetical protein